MRVSTGQKLHLLMTVLFLIALFLPGCDPSQSEINATTTHNAAKDSVAQIANVPTQTNTPTRAPEPRITPIPTSTATTKPSPTPFPTKVLPQLLESDTADLFILPGMSFMIPPGWDIQLMNPEIEYNKQISPLLSSILFIHPNGNIALMFEILKASDLQGDSSKPLESYSNLWMEYLTNAYPDHKVVNQSNLASFSSDGMGVVRQIDWVDDPNKLEGTIMLALDPTGTFVYQFQGIQEIGATDLIRVVKFGFTTFFPPAMTRDCEYAPLKEEFNKFGFVFGSPPASRIFLSSFAGKSDQSALYENGRITILPPWEEEQNKTYLAWFANKSEAEENDLQKLMLRDIAKLDNSATIIGQGTIFFTDPSTNKIAQGKYLAVETDSKQVMVGSWWCSEDDRNYILHLENGQYDVGVESLYLFQRYLISFHCQESKTK